MTLLVKAILVMAGVLSCALPQASEKLPAKIVVAMSMGILYMVTKRIDVPIVVHMISNLRWVP